MKRETSQVYGWENCPEPIKKKVKNILAYFRESLGENLVGFYLHGSLSQGCFNLNTSDIDFLVVINNKLDVPQKKAIISFLQSVDEGPGKASPEISIVTQESLKNLVYPSPFELHYSNGNRDIYTSGTVSWEERRFDTGLPAHFLAIKERGACLYGKSVHDMFPEIPPEMVIASIVQDLNWIKPQIKTLPFTYIILNPCRALAYIKEGKYMSKKEGGEWGQKNLLLKYTHLIEKALAAYSGVDTVPPPVQDSLAEFIDYAIKEFIYLAAKADAENLYFKRSY